MPLPLRACRRCHLLVRMVTHVCAPCAAWEAAYYAMAYGPRR